MCRLEKHEPASDIYTAVVDSLKALDPNQPIREADIDQLAVTIRDFMTTRPSTTLADFYRHGIPKSFFL